MSENLRKKLVNAYFMQKPEPDYSPQILFGIGGLFVSIIGSMMKSDEGFTEQSIRPIGWIFILVGVGIIVSQIMVGKQKSEAGSRNWEKATDQQMDDWLEGDKQMILKEALQSLDMESDDAKARPLMIDGALNTARIAIGNDKVIRYSAHNILIFYLTEHHVATFQCSLDMATGCLFQQSTREFPYKDITNLETITVHTSMTFVADWKTATKGRQAFSLHTSGGNKISIDYFFSKFAANENYILPRTHAETTIKAVRKKLKEYKDRLIAGATELNMS